MIPKPLPVVLALLLSSFAVTPLPALAAPSRPTRASLPAERMDDPPALTTEGTAGTSTAASVSFGRFTSVQVNVNGVGANILGDAANEPSIAVDPTNHNRMAIGWRQFASISSNFREAGFGYTTNGGLAWTTGKIQPGVFRSDPVLGFDAAGKFFYNSLSNSPALRTDIFPSLDHGATWGAPVFAYGGDKQWMTIDRTAGPGASQVYQAWSTAQNAYDPDTFDRSTTAGASYELPTSIPGSPVWGTLDVAPDGTLFVVGIGFEDTLLTTEVAHSNNARYSAMTPAFTTVKPDLGGTITFGGWPNPGGLLGQLWVAVDRSTGPRSGWVYVLGSVPTANDPSDVHFIRSTDGGQTWSAPVRVNDDTPGNRAWQWFGTMSVSPNGRIDVAWNDTRGSADSSMSALYYAYSTDGGSTWSRNEQASPSWNSRIGWPNQSKIGDYYQMISDNDGADLAWAATFNGEEDIYYLRIPRVNPFQPLTTGLPGLFKSSMAWGDYDNDGDLDLVFAGTDGVNQQTHLYRNDGGTLVEVNAGLAGVEWCSVAWGDDDGDGDLDLALAGWNGTSFITKLYRNDGGTFVDTNANLRGLGYCTLAWADLDNDGDLDLFGAGLDNTSQTSSRVYYNIGGVLSESMTAVLPGLYNADAAWGDYDNDGDMDLALSGNDTMNDYTMIERNDGGLLGSAGIVLPGVREGSLEWGDYDADGDLDLLITGWTGSQPLCRVYRNDGGGTFTIAADLTGVGASAAAWGDCDNDGDLDIVTSGYGDILDGIAHVYVNDLGTFVDASAGLTGVYYSSTAWGDLDNDRDLDLALSGIHQAGLTPAQFYRNNVGVTNQPPGAPTNLSAVRSGGQMTFSWSAPSDDHTPAAGLSYNLRVGTTAGGNQIMSAMALGSGFRSVARIGNVQQRTSWKLTLPVGVYYWGVQAIDGAFQGSAFAEQQVTVGVGDAASLPSTYELRAVAPNPTPGATTIGYALPKEGPVTLSVFDLAGRRVASVVSGTQSAGVHAVAWTGRADDGTPLADGLYLVRMEAGGGRWTRKLVLAR